MTVSIGVATLHPKEDWMTWMQRSDDYLYRAKSAGRNQVMCM
ncbi:diguanylate cyclase domain-containing protein [Acaryochloris marina NIES-2412]